MANGSLRTELEKIGKGKRLPATVIDVSKNTVSVRIGGTSRVLRGLSYVGGPITVGQNVYVDYSSGSPIVQAQSTASVSGASISSSSPSSSSIVIAGGDQSARAPSPHALDGEHHTGTISDIQAPQFLKIDGSRALQQNLAVVDGATIDGVDVSVHAGLNAKGAHSGVGDHTHETAGAEGGKLDHGSALTGLGDDDHPQYAMRARQIVAGDGLVGGGDLSVDRTLSLNAPGSLSASSVNSLVGNHTHAIVSSSNPGISSSLLATDASGRLTLDSLNLIGSSSQLILSIGTYHNVFQVTQSGNLCITPYTYIGIGTNDPQAILEISSEDIQLFLSYAINPSDNLYFSVQPGFGVMSSTGSLIFQASSDIILAPYGNGVYPQFAYQVDLGKVDKKFLSLHVAELWSETLVAQNTMATIGGRVLIGPTNVLTTDMLSASTTISLKYGGFVNGDVCYLESDNKVEFIRIASTPSGAGPYTYTIVRNLDGSGANNWYAGDAIFNTGQASSGFFMDLYSGHGVKTLSEYGPTIVGNLRNSSIYNDWSPVWAIGNLNGLYGYPSDTPIPGVALGSYQNNSVLVIDPINGIRFIDEELSVRGRLSATSWTIGKVAAGESNIMITPTSLSIRNNLTERIGLTSAGVLTVRDSAGAAVITLDAAAGAEITKMLAIKGTAAALSIGVTPPTSSSLGTGLWLDKTGLYSLASNVRQVWIDAATGDLKAGNGDITFNKTGMFIKQGYAEAGQSPVSYAINFNDGDMGVVRSSIFSYTAGLMNDNWLAIHSRARDASASAVIELKAFAADGTSSIFRLSRTSVDIYSLDSAGVNLWIGGNLSVDKSISIGGSYISGPDGWTPAGETWTYVSATSFRVSGNVIAKYAKGTKLKLTNSGSVKYFYVTNATYASPNTTVTITGGSSYSLVSGAITDNYYSYATNPVGHPHSFPYNAAASGSTGTAGTYSEDSAAARFWIVGDICHVVLNKRVLNKGSWGGDVLVLRPVIRLTTGMYIDDLVSAVAQGAIANKAVIVGESNTHFKFHDLFGASVWTWTDLAVNDWIAINTAYFI